MQYPGGSLPRLQLERVTSVLRDRIRDAAEMGAMKTGDRLPGTRTLASELGVDPRLVASALRRLEQEGLVDMRPRSGVYLAAQKGATQGDIVLPLDWAAEIISQAIERGVPAHRLSAAVERMTDTNKVRAAVIAATSDQAVGMVRELQDDYGITSAATFPEQLRGAQFPKSLLRAHLIVTTLDLATSMRKIAAELGKQLIVVRVRLDLFTQDGIALVSGPVFVVVADPRFRAILRQAIKPLPGAANVKIVLANSDELPGIPPDARTYVTESARRMLGRGELPGRMITPRRIFSSETVREITAFLVAFNA